MTTTQIDEKNSPARLVIRRYILFILTMALEENMSMYQDFLLYHADIMTKYKDDFGLSALCTRLESFLANPDFDHHLISISGFLGACAHNGIPIPSRIYAALVDKVATEILSQGTDPDDVKRKNLQVSTAINQVIGFRIANGTLLIPDCGDEMVRTLLTKDSSFGRAVLSTVRFLSDESFLRSQNALQASVEPVRTAIVEFACALGLVEEQEEPTHDPIARSTQRLANIVGLQYTLLQQAVPSRF
ncbi:hypothetical protein EV421DRAFT_1733985 [Armillaria borealis]|uniref:Uncharacterized protein n=1 Tax=Armillaria borealis TaxID=47425 RepID=A0AA39JRP3_9AGAR|nr:hypothetical protein EV421DRAFT_1733985 [Armillaria borealis]